MRNWKRHESTLILLSLRRVGDRDDVRALSGGDERSLQTTIPAHQSLCQLYEKDARSHPGITPERQDGMVTR